MRAADIVDLLKKERFEPFVLGLSDGRSVLIRHPDQAVVTERHILVGLAKIGRSKPLATPASGDTIAKDWMLVNVLHVTTIEPLESDKKEKNGKNGRRKRPPKRRGGS